MKVKEIKYQTGNRYKNSDVVEIEIDMVIYLLYNEKQSLRLKGSSGSRMERNICGDYE